ncbi:hypothetical protein ACGFNY_04935 [Streptomyces chartreusis]|uniref:hypothetical protein n=1 Tax=Streptomyces chartreusis TaxID=1969 RepID=UPI0037239FA0
MTTTPDDAHVQHTWQLTHDNGDEISIDLWTDGYTVHVDGGPDNGEQWEGGRADVDHLLTKYRANGYRLARDYAVNDPEPHDEPVEDDDPEPDGRPERCPECSAPVVYDPRFGDEFREGAAWLCTGCKWGQYLTA